MRTNASVVCNIGCLRTNNEDNFLFGDYFMPRKEMDKGSHLVSRFSGSRNLFAIFDGMGGGARGEYASCLCASQLQQWTPKFKKGAIITEVISQYALETNHLVHADAVRLKAKMQGSTMAFLLLRGRSAYIANIGDSRVYLKRKDMFKQVTFDHSSAGVLQKQGMLSYEEVRNFPNSNVIHQYLGMSPKVIPKEFVSTYQLPVCHRDRFILCSDGLSDLLPQKLLETAVQSAKTADILACRLVRAALELGGKDNVTCMVIDVLDRRLPAPDTDDPLFRAGGDRSTVDTVSG